MIFFLPCACPLANDIDALSVFSRAVISARPALYNSTALDIPWRDLPKSQSMPKLRLGLVGEDPAFPLHPPVKRALAEAVQALQRQGHEVVPIHAARARVADATSLACNLLYLDDMALRHVAASGEPIVPSVKKTGRAFNNLNNNFCANCKDLKGLPKVAALTMKREELAEQWRAVWKDEDLHGVIGPANQGPASHHDTYGLTPYTVLLSVLDVRTPSVTHQPCNC